MPRLGWGVMTVLAQIIAAYAIALLFVPAMRAPFLQERFIVVPVAAYLHLAGSGIALAVGAFQHNARLRGRYLNAHRWLGRTYVISVLLGGTAAFALATMSQFGLPTHVGFGMLAVLWLFATARAYFYIRAGDQISHRRWMVRSYALTFAAVTLRIYLPLSQVAGIPFDAAYQTISWLCWVPNLIVAEWIILRQRGSTALRPGLVVIAVASVCVGACGGRAPERRAENVSDTATVAADPEPSSDITPSLRSTVEKPAYELGPEYVLHGACPFDCCRYGKLTMIRGGTLRAAPNFESDSVWRVADGARVQTDSGLVIMHPTGLSVIVAEAPALRENLSGPRVGDTLEILNSAGEGKHRVRWQGVEFNVVTAELGRPVAWLQTLREPAQSWWLYMTDSASQQSGWMRIGGMRGELNQAQDANACSC